MYLLNAALHHLREINPLPFEGQVARGAVLASMAGLSTKGAVALVWENLCLEDEPSTLTLVAEILAEALHVPFEDTEAHLLEIAWKAEAEGQAQPPWLGAVLPSASLRKRRQRACTSWEAAKAAFLPFVPSVAFSPIDHEDPWLARLRRTIQEGKKDCLAPEQAFQEAAIQNAYLQTLPGQMPGENRNIDRKWCMDASSVTGLAFADVVARLFCGNFAERVRIAAKKDPATSPENVESH